MKNKRVVEVTDVGLKETRLETSSPGDAALGMAKVKKDPLKFSLSPQSCSDIRISSKVHHRFKIISL